MEILLTNDDSFSSPLFHMIMKRLRNFGNLTIVVPKEEQSWKGKSITRFAPLSVDEIKLSGHHAYSVDGTPADCVNIALYNLVNKKPDLVISGINIGLNTGISFALSSGTIGACIEANIAGIPAIALSQKLNRDIFQNWVKNKHFDHDVIHHLQNQHDVILDKILNNLIGSKETFASPIIWNVNMPYQISENWQIKPAILGRSFYGSCFKKVNDHYEHDLNAVYKDTSEESDDMVVQGGNISLTKIDIRDLGLN